MYPEWWYEAEDGLYGNEDAFIDDLKTGRPQEAYNLRVLNNGCCETKIRQWLNSSRTNVYLSERTQCQVTGRPMPDKPTGPHIPGCADSEDN